MSLLWVAGLMLACLLYVRWIPLYVILGFLLWLSVLGSGVHPTVAGVLTALFVPARGKYNTDLFAQKAKAIIEGFECGGPPTGYWFSILMHKTHLNAVHSLRIACNDVETPLQRMEHGLHPWVIYLVLPLFALANAGLTFEGMDLAGSAFHPVTLGVVLGLLVGKPVGITLFSFLAIRMGAASLPEGVRWAHIAGAGMLGGIGFTISLFISGLSFTAPEILNNAKLGVLSGSILSACAGIAFLSRVCARKSDGNGQPEGERPSG